MLVAAPYRLSIKGILRLTRAQVRELYFVPRDEWGNLRREDAPPDDGPADPEAPLRLLAVRRGWPGWLTEKWLAKLRAGNG